MPEQESRYICFECGEVFESLTDEGECPECGQEYVFPPENMCRDMEVLTPNGSSETYDTVEEAVNAEDGFEDDEVIVSSEELEGDGPDCLHCGEAMYEAPDHIDADWLCHNDGCEGAFTEEELKDDEEEEKEEKQQDLLWAGEDAS